MNLGFLVFKGLSTGQITPTTPGSRFKDVLTTFSLGMPY